MTSREGRRSIGALFALAAMIALHASPARAFRNKDRFSDSVDDGGGGQKYFTGSRAEGYTCQVCHTAGDPVALQIYGLPITGYTPGTSYRLTLDWPDNLPSVAVNVEMTDLNGATFGELSAPDPSTLAPADLCSSSDQPDASQAVMLSGARRVLLIGECGQTQSTFDWRAPLDAKQGFITGSLLVSNRNGKVTGDRVVDFSRTFGAVGNPTPTVNAYTGSNCAVARARGLGTSRVEACGWIVLALFTVLRRARRRSAAEDTTLARDDLSEL